MDKPDKFEATALDHASRIAAMTDDEVRAAYLATDGIPGDPWVESLVTAMQARNINV